MARRPHKQYRRKGGKRKVYLPYNQEFSLGAIADEDVITAASAHSAQDRMYLITHIGTWATHGFTAAEGPVQFGLAHSDLTAAEIEEYLENTAAWFEDDLIGQLTMLRGKWIKRVGVLSLLTPDEILFDGRPKKTRLGFYINEDAKVNLWARAAGGAVTTGGAVVTDGFIIARRA